VRVRLDVSYEGTDFSGWARQPGQRTVQAVLEEALATILRLPAVALTVAGRTDAGVHATGQVAHCDVPELPDGLLRHLAGVLPPDVRVRRVQEVVADFDARFSALRRRYEYRIADAPGGAEPLRRRFVLGWPRSLDVQLMAAAAHPLLGLHDFVAFCRRREGATTVRSLERLTVERSGPEIVATVVADAFCHSMVRSLVGALIAVGEGRRPADWPASLFDRDSRAGDVPVAAAHGLTLAAVEYPADAELAERAETTRARRAL